MNAIGEKKLVTFLQKSLVVVEFIRQHLAAAATSTISCFGISTSSRAPSKFFLDLRNFLVFLSGHRRRSFAKAKKQNKKGSVPSLPTNIRTKDGTDGMLAEQNRTEQQRTEWSILRHIYRQKKH